MPIVYEGGGGEGRVQGRGNLRRCRCYSVVRYTKEKVRCHGGKTKLNLGRENMQIDFGNNTIKSLKFSHVGEKEEKNVSYWTVLWEGSCRREVYVWESSGTWS